MIEGVAWHLKALPAEFLNGVVITLIAIGYITALVLGVLLLVGIGLIYDSREKIFSIVIIRILIIRPFLNIRVGLLNFLTNHKPILLNPIIRAFFSYRVKLLNFMVKHWNVPKRLALFILHACLTISLIIGALSILPVILIFLSRPSITIETRIALITGIAATGALIGFLVAPFVTLKYRKKGFVRATGLYFGTIVAGSEAAMLAVLFLVAMTSD